MERKYKIDAGLELLSTTAVAILEDAHSAAVTRRTSVHSQQRSIAILKTASSEIGVLADAMTVLLNKRAIIG